MTWFPISRRSLLACLAAAILAAVLLAAALYAPASSPDSSAAKVTTSTSQPQTTAAAASCPRSLEPDPRAPERVLRALRSAVPRTWHYTTPDGPLKLSVRNTLVQDLQSLAGDSQNLPRFSSYYGKLARRMCGDMVARRTWVAVVHFPDSQAATYAEKFAFFARTRTGWKLWYHN